MVVPHAVIGARHLALIPLQGGALLELALLFVILAIVAAVLGARGIAGMTITIAKWLVLLFILLAILSIILPGL